MRARNLGFILVTAGLGSGCFRSVVRSGEPPGDAPAAYDERWHSGWVGGLIEASGPHALDQACPEGWAEVRVETDPLHSFLNVVTLYIYSPQAVTVICAAKGGRETPAQTAASAYPPKTQGYPPAALPPPGD